MYATGFRKKPTPKIKNKARSRVSPWRNRAEFEDTYLKIFGPDVTFESKKTGCERLKIWKIRRGAETPACVLGTLTLLEAELQDNGEQTESTLSHVYSSAFTRFLNCVTSIVDITGKQKTMYVAAKELGLDSHMVDLRHLCSHGRTLPGLDVFRSSASYCMNWIKEFYWERELNVIQVASAKDLKRFNATRFVKNLRKYFIIYDAVTHSIYNGIEDINKIISAIEDPESRKTAEEYLTELGLSDMQSVLSCVIRDLIKASKSRIIQENAFYFASELLSCPNFIKNSCAEKKKLAAVQLHHKLFYEMMRNGYIDKFFYRCIFIAEDRFENNDRRKCAAFWIDKILEGLQIMYLMGPITRKDFETFKELNLAEREAYKELVKLCKNAGIDTKETLILHNFILNSIQIEITDEFVKTRLENSDIVSAIYIDRLMNFVKDEKQKLKFQKLVNFILIFKSDDNQNEKDSRLPVKRRKIFTVEDDLLPLLSAENLKSIQEKQQFGIWRVADKLDWKNVPLGHKICENKEE